MMVLLQTATPHAQKISDKEIYFNLWHITNVSLDSSTIINKDTLILRQALVTSINQSGVKQLDNLTSWFLPASVYSYNIGNITLKMKTN